MEPFTLTVSFRVVATAQRYFTLQKLHQRLPKATSETWVTVRYYFLWHAKSADPVFKKQSSHVWRCYIIGARHKNNIFRKTINNGKYSRVPTCRTWQPEDEIHRYLRKWLGRNVKRLQQSIRALSTNSTRLTNNTMSTETVNGCKHILPIKTAAHFSKKLANRQVSTESRSV